MGYSRTGWAASVITPWCLGIALAASISADAGQESWAGASLSPLPVSPLPLPPQGRPGEMPPAGPRTAVFSSSSNDFGGLTGDARQILKKASLSIGDGDDFHRLPDEIEPRRVLKRDARMFPSVDRSHKGDPLVGLRPAFDSHRQAPPLRTASRAGDGPFEPGDSPPAEPSSEPWLADENPATARSGAAASPGTRASPATKDPLATKDRLRQGATPAVLRAAALSSVTPAPANATPVEVVALSGEPRSPADTAHPDFAALSTRDLAARENRCLAEAIYFEARGESDEGQAAVAQVVLNRVASGLYPSTICGAVYQNRNRWHGCQFSFACDGKSLRISEPEAFAKAERIAAEVTAGKTFVADVADSTHYHANYARPRWARRLEKMDMIGHHVFYKLRPGQS